MPDVQTDQQYLSSDLDKHKNNLRRLVNNKSISRANEREASRNTPLEVEKPIDRPQPSTNDRLQLKSGQKLCKHSKPHESVDTISVDLSLRNILASQKLDKNNASNFESGFNSRFNTVQHESEDNVTEPRRSQRVLPTNFVKDQYVSYDNDVTTRNKNRLDYFSNNTQSSIDLKASNETKAANLLLMGTDDGQTKPLSAHFNKNHKFGNQLSRKDKKEKPNNRQTSLDVSFSKSNLRKKMLDYGKKIEKPKAKVSDIQVESTASLQMMNKARSDPKFTLNYEKNMPKPEILERLSRGIKPTVDKSEIYEITKRHRQRFEKLNTQNGVEASSKNNSKKAELVERKNKVKELDQVDQQSNFQRVRENLHRGLKNGS